MTNSIVGSDIDLRFAGRGLSENGVYLGRVRISAHHRSRLRIDGLDLAHPVVFFHRSREFVFADPVDRVIG